MNASKPPVSRPNVILCLCDQLRWCETGCYGNPNIRTPAIDRLAGQGTRFETAISNNPVCMAARSAVLSGQYSRTCAGNLGNTALRLAGGGWILPQWPSVGRPTLSDQTLPECLRQAGYTTTALGKWHVESWPSDVGFDYYEIPAVQHAHSAQRFCKNGESVYAAPGYSVDHEGDMVGSFLNTRSGAAEPFFLYYNISPPHMPLADAPERYTTMYGRDDVVVRPNVDLSRKVEGQHERFLNYLWDYRHYRDHLPYAEKFPKEDFNLLDLHAMYMGLTTWVDDAVGRMMTALRDTGLDENTIVIFASDHGDNLGSHGWMGKGTLNEESIHVPMMVSGPGIQTGRTSAQVATLIDLAPTILDMAGVTVPAHMQGQSLTPVLSGAETTLSRNFALIETEGHGVGIRTPTHLYGLPWKEGSRDLGDEPHFFYDLSQDPYQQHPLDSADPLAKQLEGQLRDWHAQTPWMVAKSG